MTARAGRATPARIRVWPIPIALAVVSGVGLIAALVGDGPWDALSWLCLAAPLAAITWSLKKRPVDLKGSAGLRGSAGR